MVQLLVDQMADVTVAYLGIQKGFLMAATTVYSMGWKRVVLTV